MDESFELVLERGEVLPFRSPEASAVEITDDARATFTNLTPVERFVEDFESTIGPAPAWSSDVYMRFLLSTDFFLYRADQARAIGYATFYEPTPAPCHDPLSMSDRDDISPRL